MISNRRKRKKKEATPSDEEDVFQSDLEEQEEGEDSVAEDEEGAEDALAEDEEGAEDDGADEQEDAEDAQEDDHEQNDIEDEQNSSDEQEEGDEDDSDDGMLPWVRDYCEETKYANDIGTFTAAMHRRFGVHLEESDEHLAYDLFRKLVALRVEVEAEIRKHGIPSSMECTCGDNMHGVALRQQVIVCHNDHCKKMVKQQGLVYQCNSNEHGEWGFVVCGNCAREMYLDYVIR